MHEIHSSSNGKSKKSKRDQELVAYGETSSGDRLIQEIFQPLIAHIRRVPIDKTELERLTQAWSGMLHDLSLIQLSPAEIVEAEICLQHFEDMLPTIGADVERGTVSAQDPTLGNALGKAFAAQMKNCIELLRHDLNMIFQQTIIAIEAHEEPKVGQQFPLPFYMDPTGKIDIGQGSSLDACVARQSGLVDSSSALTRPYLACVNGDQLARQSRLMSREWEPPTQCVA